MRSLGVLAAVAGTMKDEDTEGNESQMTRLWAKKIIPGPRLTFLIEAERAEWTFSIRCNIYI